MRKQPRLRASSSARDSSVPPHASAPRGLRHHEVVHSRLRPMVAESLVVLHVDDAQHRAGPSGSSATSVTLSIRRRCR